MARVIEYNFAKKSDKLCAEINSDLNLPLPEFVSCESPFCTPPQGTGSADQQDFSPGIQCESDPLGISVEPTTSAVRDGESMSAESTVKQDFSPDTQCEIDPLGEALCVEPTINTQTSAVRHGESMSAESTVKQDFSPDTQCEIDPLGEALCVEPTINTQTSAVRHGESMSVESTVNQDYSPDTQCYIDPLGEALCVESTNTTQTSAVRDGESMNAESNVKVEPVKSVDIETDYFEVKEERLTTPPPIEHTANQEEKSSNVELPTVSVCPIKSTQQNHTSNLSKNSVQFSIPGTKTPLCVSTSSSEKTCLSPNLTLAAIKNPKNLNVHNIISKSLPCKESDVILGLSKSNVYSDKKSKNPKPRSVVLTRKSLTKVTLILPPKPSNISKPSHQSLKTLKSRTPNILAIKPPAQGTRLTDRIRTNMNQDKTSTKRNINQPLDLTRSVPSPTTALKSLPSIEPEKNKRKSEKLHQTSEISESTVLHPEQLVQSLPKSEPESDREGDEPFVNFNGSSDSSNCTVLDCQSEQCGTETHIKSRKSESSTPKHHLNAIVTPQILQSEVQTLPNPKRSRKSNLTTLNQPLEFAEFTILEPPQKQKSRPSRNPNRHRTKPKPSYSCLMCPFKSKDQEQFSEHQLLHTSDGFFGCNLCSHKYLSLLELKEHKKVKHPPPPLECDHCGFKSLKTNLMETHLNPRFQQTCKICKKSFNHVGCLKYHTHSIHNIKDTIYSCQICDYNTHKKSTMSWHRSTHKKKENIVCTECKKVFNRRECMRRHLRVVHKMGVQHSCPHCDYTTALKPTLKKHIRTHTGEKPFGCEFCDKRFNEKNARDCHVNSLHTRAKVFPCPYCTYIATIKFVLKSHMRAKHRDKIDLVEKDKEYFGCAHCGKQYCRKARLYTHIVTVHLKPVYYGCGKCEFRTSRKQHLYRHMLVHTRPSLFNCSLCSKGFAKKWTLQQHVLHIHLEPKRFKKYDPSFRRYQRKRDRQVEFESGAVPGAGELRRSNRVPKPKVFS